MQLEHGTTIPLREDFPERAIAAFEEYIWPRIAARGSRQDFAPDATLRLLAGDPRLWMHRLFRVALDLHEEFEVCEEEEKWNPLEKISEEFYSQLPEDQKKNFLIRRPLKGGDLWDVQNQQECDDVVDQMLDGYGAFESLRPVLDVLHSDRTHDDFSDRYSWVKEDFERSFYSKRAKVKVTLQETMDDFPAWSAGEPAGYESVLFRDLLSFFNPKERHLIVAIRNGKTVSEIAREEGLACHTAMSRKIKKLKARLRRLLP